jgi:ankyrin repeat protein/tRNA A-37 threonylcarbamoyl transferase component Bud32
MNPERIGGYEILGELGRGAMGVVYQARDPGIGRTVAIKVIRVDQIMSPDEGLHLRQRLIREAGAAGKMSHPGIVTVYQLGEDGGNVFIVMEFVEGSSLDRLLMNNPVLDRSWTLDILSQIAVALDYAHKASVVHRDIKPANILVRSDGRVKIADFGIAKVTAGATTAVMTVAGVSVGSPAYMSPEQIQAKPVDGHSDQFALGTIAFQMLTGRMPFKGDTAHTLMFQIVMGDPFEIQPGDNSLSPEIRAVLSRALAKNPQDRYPDCASFIQSLAGAVSGVKSPVAQAETIRMEAFTSPAVAPPPPGPPPPPPPRPTGGKSWMALPVIGGILALAAIGGGGYWYIHRTSAPAPVPAPIAEVTPPAPAPPVKEPVKEPPVEAKKEPEPAAPAKKQPGGKAEVKPDVKASTTKTAAKADATPVAGMTLHQAVTRGRIDVAKSLLAKGASINEKDQDGSTALMIAAGGTTYLTNNRPMVQMLIDERASLEARDPQGRTALHRAATYGMTDAVELLLESGALTSPRAKDGATPLYNAVQFGKMAALEKLIAHHAQVDLADAVGNTPLMIASEGTPTIGNNLPIVEALLAAGAKVDIGDARGRTALHRASAEAKPDIVRVLLDNKAKPNLKAKDGSTPLIQAVTYARPAVAQLLITRGADVNMADLNGSTPLMVAADASTYIKDPAHLIKLLLDHGAKPGLKDSKGRTAFQRATESKNTAAMELLK